MSSLIDFKKCIGNSKQAGRGIPIGEYLVVSYAFGSENTYQIFRLHDGRLFISTVFTSLDDAKNMAQWFNETFCEYMIIWKDYPDADIIALTKYSVKDGTRIFEMVKQIKNKKVSKIEIGAAWETANNWMD